MTLEDKPMQIDIYYSRPISGILISYLFTTAIEIEKFQGNETYSFKVANPGVLLVLKYFAYNKADKNNEEKYWNDINSLLYRYCRIYNFFSKFGGVIKNLFSRKSINYFKKQLNIIVVSEMLGY